MRREASRLYGNWFLYFNETRGIASYIYLFRYFNETRGIASLRLNFFIRFKINSSVCPTPNHRHQEIPEVLQAV